MKHILFLYLKAFSFTGGIEKFNRCFLKALGELSAEGLGETYSISAYDSLADERYFPNRNFSGHSGDRIGFSVHALRKSFSSDVVILGHINLAVLGYAMKKLRPKLKIILIAHGIEVWKKYGGVKLKFLNEVDQIFAVSNFTKNQIFHHNPSVDLAKISIFPNALDPFLNLPSRFEKPAYLLKRYNFSAEDRILLTVARLSSSEIYKGYDQTIRAVSRLGSENRQNIKYLICGKADPPEMKRLNGLIEREGLLEKVLLPDFIDDEELGDHYLLADVFVMPSEKEGFGIVFIEALAHGCKVIAGSKDGSAEALQNGTLGDLVDPDSELELKEAIINALRSERVAPVFLQSQVVAAFGFPQFKKRLHDYLIAI